MKQVDKIFSLLCTLIIIGLASCTKEADPAALAPVIKGLETEYYLLVNEKLALKPVIENEVTSVEWFVNGKKVADTQDFIYTAPSKPGKENILFRACNNDNITQQTIIITSDKYLGIITSVGQLTPLKTGKKLSEQKSINWEMIEAASPLYRLSDTESKTPLFVTSKNGTYRLRAVAEDMADTVIVLVKQQLGGISPYISEVFEYLPAPGQYVNEIPMYSEGDTQETMNAKALKLIGGSDRYVLTLGGWGGSIIFGFDYTITNVADKCDFRVLGNAFGANSNLRPKAPFGGSCEPGIITVGYDKNKNGKPDDDEWYEIKGSGNFTAENEPWYGFAKEEGNDVETYRDYEMTYYRPETEETDPDYDPEKDGGFYTIKKYLRWRNNKGKEGYKVKNRWHKQTYYPAWIKEDKITYKGIRLADNGVNEYKFNPGANEEGLYYVLYAFRYGYVDNYPNGFDNAGIDIDWAIDKDGNPANLPGIDFVKVYNGIDKENSWLGESSTEVAGAQDLHMLGFNIDTIKE